MRHRRVISEPESERARAADLSRTRTRRGRHQPRELRRLGTTPKIPASAFPRLARSDAEDEAVADRANYRALLAYDPSRARHSSQLLRARTRPLTFFFGQFFFSIILFLFFSSSPLTFREYSNASLRLSPARPINLREFAGTSCLRGKLNIEECIENCSDIFFIGTNSFEK